MGALFHRSSRCPSANEISRRGLWSSATHHKRCRMCGAPTPAAGISGPRRHIPGATGQHVQGRAIPSHPCSQPVPKDCCRFALGDKAVKSGPEVSFVGMAFSLSCARKRLTWTTSGPDGAGSPSGDLQGEIPSGDPSKEMAAVVSFKVISGNLLDTSFVDIASHDMPGGDQVPQPCRGERIVFVVVGGHRWPAKIYRSHSTHRPRDQNPHSRVTCPVKIKVQHPRRRDTRKRWRCSAGNRRIHGARH